MVICHVSPTVDLRIIRLTLLAPFRGDRRRQSVVDRALQFQRERRAGGQRAAADPPGATAQSLREGSWRPSDRRATADDVTGPLTIGNPGEFTIR